ncbi:hypothetical protein PAAG_01551 [Paracoccidioides lutzii Pb01]|uniref:Uncharacterized protein n=1 Tax=Paracoccidioides lutzii (strain ATCC MYA-826 / Pb01) TaxID=502779 RepID=C1GSQ6_PARBA|nr:hypothetical protein PAAG_01551 [Paracoccidioides lutzii Pb01]EEH39089.2 hypothetical protein PAAG_01551 [Paracoccidioides lutzii Pb01]
MSTGDRLGGRSGSYPGPYHGSLPKLSSRPKILKSTSRINEASPLPNERQRVASKNSDMSPPLRI